MKTMLFGNKDPMRRHKNYKSHGSKVDGRSHNPSTVEEAFDTAHGAALLTPEFDKDNDDVTAIRSSLGLDTDKRHPPSE